MISGRAGEAVLPSIVQMMRSHEGIRGFVEFYCGTQLTESRVVSVSSVSEWKQALVDAGSRPLVALFIASSDLTCRIVGPAFSRLAGPKEDEGVAEDGGEEEGAEAQAEFPGVVFVQVVHDATQDDGLALQVFDEAYVGRQSVPSVLFFDECLERRKWRYAGADVGEVAKRLRRILEASEEELEEGPGAGDV